jgi:1-acyl-sn-glycerol-3-phosphate acyltransferase
MKESVKQESCEREGRFDLDLRKYSTKNLLKIDGDYRYLCTRPYERAMRAGVMTLLGVLYRPVLFFLTGFCVRGRGNLKGVKGAISVSNHVHVLDGVMVHAMRALPWKVYHTGAAFNMKRGLRGEAMRWMGYLPISSSFGAQKNFHRVIGELLGHGCLVHFYPERALWTRYEKIRPFKSGAFKYAARFSVPVLPAFIAFEETFLRRKLGLKKRATMYILPPVYPLQGAGERDSAAYLQAEVEREMREAYERIYKKKMVFTTKSTASL